MHILITGARGFLGVRAVSHLSARHRVTAPLHAELDITDAAAVSACVRQLAPDAVIHCAAVSDTGEAARHPERSYIINVEGTANVARACAETGCKLVYMSSDQVYDGLPVAGLLREEQAGLPPGPYGRHKLQAEQAAAALCADAVGLRLSWMYDVPAAALSPNRGLLPNLARAVADDAPVRAALHEYRGITYVWDVVERLEAAFDLPGGVYNFGSENTLSTYATFLLAARCFARPPRIVADTERFARCPRNLSMDTARLKACGIHFPTTAETLRRLHF